MSNAHFEDELRRHGVQKINEVGCTADTCLPLSAVDLKARGYDVTMVQDHCYGAERAMVARTSPERAEEIRAMLYRLPNHSARLQAPQLFEMARAAYVVVERFNKAWAPYARRHGNHPKGSLLNN